MRFRKRKDIVWIGFLLIVVMILSLGIVLSNTLKDNLETDAIRTLEKDTIIISEKVNTYFSQGYITVDQMLTNEVFKDYILKTETREEKRLYYRYDETQRMLENIKDSNQDLLNVWLGIDGINDLLTDTGEFEAGPDYIYVTRPWYLEMIGSGERITYTNPYLDLIKLEMVISVVGPYTYEDEIIGVAGIDLEIGVVEDYIHSYNIGEDGSAFLYSDEGRFIVEPSMAEYETIIDRDEFQSNLFYLDEKKSGIKKIEINGEDFYLGYSLVEYPNWYVVTLLPEDEVFYNSFLLRLLDFNRYFLIIAIFIMTYLLVKMRTSYRELNEAHDELLDKEQELRHLNELTEASYNQLMASEEELYRQNDEITRYNKEILEQQEYIKKLAEEDPLTGIPNRRSFFKQLQHSIDNKKCGVVVMIDLDNFKEINDVLGHVYGDEILKVVAKSLASHAYENVFVSRYGGDEFLISIEFEECNNRVDLFEASIEYIKKITKVVNQKYMEEDEEIFIEGTLGISLYPFDSEDVNDLLMYSDLAMYETKGSHDLKYGFFNDEMASNLARKSKVEKVLRNAIDKCEFELLYQPLVDCNTGYIKSFEALIRLKEHKIYPDEFILVAEETGQIFEIGRWVLDESIRTLASWKKKGFELKPIAINLSVRQINDAGFIKRVEKLLKENDIDGKYLEVEVTESIFLDNEEKVVHFFEKLTKLGIKFALDDFGTGYASLSYLDYIPLSKLKIDKYLIDKDYNEPNGTGLVPSIIVLAHNFNMIVVAEGVEVKEQYERLSDMNCDLIQGYYFSKPCKKDDIEEIFDKNFLK